ncbi:MAG: hypothetical protein Q9174_007224 [Haloplaca sp. 1 TL-2023]
MVAVRSAGLAFESVIGIVRPANFFPGNESRDGVDMRDGSAKLTSDGYGTGGSGREGEEIVQALVTEEYLEMVVGIANQRFVANGKRVRRFEEMLFQDDGKKEWEDGEERRQRKRREGLERREKGQRDGKTKDGGVEVGSVSDDNGDPSVEVGIGDLEDGF